VTFQVQLGSLGDKMRRLRSLVPDIALAIGGSRENAVRAAELAKCDLLTAMVGEFPELQGIMGTYYAQADGEGHEIALAIREHYLPRGAGDELPVTRAGLALAVADKLDTLAGIFAIGEKPSGTKDPFGLRRAALGVQRILIEKGLDLDLTSLIAKAVTAVRADIGRLAAQVPKPAGPARPAAPARSSEDIGAEIYGFLMERLRAYYLDGAGGAGRAPVSTEMFEAVLAARPASPVDFDARLKALSTFLALPEAASLTAANKRIANILRKANESPGAEVDVQQLREEAEVRLYDSMRALRESVSAATAHREYAGALGTLAQLRPAVDAFFDQVMVMDENPKLRANRLSLLAQLQGFFSGVADLSRLPG
jgi:glycyl-tRNA synthetase beta chain